MENGGSVAVGLGERIFDDDNIEGFGVDVARV